jgi:hypothetical protein
MCDAANILRRTIEDLRGSIADGYDRARLGKGYANARESGLLT